MHDNFINIISNKVNQQSFIHGNNRAMYKLTNADVFDKFADESNYYNYNSTFTQEEKMAMSKQFFDQIITRPFVNILKVLISFGADPHATVGKLKRYRDLEEQKRQQLLALAEQEGQPKILAKMSEEEKKVMRREEKLEEIRKRQAYGRGKVATKKAVKSSYSVAVNLLQLPNQVDHNVGNEVYDKFNGEKVLREYGPQGQRNAVHFITAQPNTTLFQFVVE
jgi:hypothetical protein